MTPGTGPRGGGESLPYPRLLRVASWRWWRPLAGLLLAFVAGLTVLLSLGAVDAVLQAQLPGSVGLFDEVPPPTPAGLLSANLLILALALPAVVAFTVAHTPELGRLCSVTGRPRLGLAARCVPLAVLTVALSIGVSILLSVAGVLPDEDLRLHLPSSGTLAGFAAVLLLTTPLQSAAEEVVFRGWLSQALGSYGRSEYAGPLVAGVVTATLFALAHLPDDPWLAANLACFGAVASWTAWRTGGLEGAIVLHAVNNVLAEAFAVGTGTLDEALAASTLAWQVALVDMAFLVGYAVLVERWAYGRERPARSGAATAAVNGLSPRPALR
ncbi:MAG: CPBP family intramembrane metalloprotease [Actinomycetota bacterium]|nr:CPBP family intramembrane metalloprotease [Actinomycetota bacterium]